MAKRYDHAYYNKWYRNPRYRVRSRLGLLRKANMVVAVTEFFLARSLRTVLDIGCGEGEWYMALKGIRPRLKYEGIDPSEHVVRSFGDSRHVRRGRLGTRSPRQYDLVICADVLHYLSDSEVRRGLKSVAAMTRGVAFIEVMTSEDKPRGDLEEFRSRNANWYRRELDKVGLISCGTHCYLTSSRARLAAALEARPGLIQLTARENLSKTSKDS